MKTTNNISLEEMVGKLKKEDMKYGRLSKAIFILYVILIPLFILFGILDYRETKAIGDIIWTLSIISAFSIFAFLFRSLMKEYQYVDYSQPTLKMLEGAVLRYQPIHPKTIWVVPALLLMDVGMYLHNPIEGTSFLQFQLFFAGILLFAIAIGVVVWYYRYKPIRDNALMLLKELEE